MRYSWLDILMFIAAIVLLIPLVMKFAEIVLEFLSCQLPVAS
jgi:hypothetical protein